jgi:hypothetical protein
MLAGDLYLADDPQLLQESRRAEALAKEFNESSPLDPAARLRLLGELLGSLGAETEIRPPLYCDYGYNLHVGREDVRETTASTRSTWPRSGSATTSRSGRPSSS